MWGIGSIKRQIEVAGQGQGTISRIDAVLEAADEAAGSADVGVEGSVVWDDDKV